MGNFLFRAALVLTLPGIACSALGAPSYSYPLAPEGNYVLLRKTDFVRWATNGWRGVGDDVGGHFGFIEHFVGGHFELIDHFVGVFAHPINPEGSLLYLWETTSGFALANEGFEPFLGPMVVIGWWDGSDFYPVLESRQVTYEVTFAPGNDPFYLISAAVVEIGPCPQCNAVKVIAAGHAQVSAIATSTYLPEAGTGWLTGAAIALICLLRYQVPMRRTRPKLKRMP